MPTTKGRRFDKCSKAVRSPTAWLSEFKRLASSNPTRSSSSSCEVSNSVEELFINSLYLTTPSSSSTNVLRNLCTSQQKIMAYERRKSSAVADSDEMGFYQVIHNSFLLDLMRNIICIGCKEQWNEKMHISKRECINDFGVDSDLIRYFYGKMIDFYFLFTSRFILFISICMQKM